MTDVYDENQLEKGLHYQVKSFSSVYLENKDGKYVMHQLPNEAQLAPINQIIAKDFDSDGILDVVIGGNLYASEVETPRADAGRGLFLKGNGKGNFTPVMAEDSGLFTAGDVKDMTLIMVQEKEYILSAKNDDFLQFIRYNKPSL